MKKLLTTLTILLLIFSCKNTPTEPKIIYQTETTTETVYVYITNNIIQTNEIDIPKLPFDFLLYENNIIYTYTDGTSEEWTNTKSAYAGLNRLSISNVLYYLDNKGEITNSKWLPTIPDKICIHGNDTYIIRNVSPQESMDAGGMYKSHSEIWLNGSTINHWSFNQFEIIDIFVSKDNTIIYQKSDFTWHDIGEVKENILYASKNVLVYDYVGGMSAKFLFNENNYNITWLLNFLANSKSFQIVGSDLYSPNGYRISSAGEIFNTDNPLEIFTIPVSAQLQMPTKFCTRIENSEEVGYWLECNSGNLYRYVKSIDQFNLMDSLYTGDNLAGTGSVIAKNLKVKMINGLVYYYYNGILWEYDFVYSTPVGSDGCEVWE